MAASLSPLDHRVYGALAAYCFDEATCSPSQALIAEDVRVARETVNRCVAALREAGWLEVRKVRHPGSRWDHCVYDLLADITGW